MNITLSPSCDILHIAYLSNKTYPLKASRDKILWHRVSIKGKEKPNTSTIMKPMSKNASQLVNVDKTKTKCRII